PGSTLLPYTTLFRSAAADARLRLAIALFHGGDLAGAQAELDRAEAVLGAEHAELLLYRGLLLLEAQRSADAAAAFERARARDPGDRKSTRLNSSHVK